MQPIQTYLHETRNEKIFRMDYDSMGAFSRDCAASNVARKYSHAGEASWWGGDSMGKLMDKCLCGEETHVAAAEQMLDQLRDEIEIPRPQWTPSAYGAFPDVPAFLAGEIDCMRHMVADPSMTAPVRVYFDPTSSAALDAETLAKRGTAALALTMALAQIRPVELWTFSDIEAKGSDLALICVRLQTNPLMLSEACFALCNPGYARGLTYGLAEVRVGFTGGWGFGENHMDTEKRAAMMRQALRASPQDIVIPGAHYADELVKDPLGFIRRELARFRQGQDDA
jgi:hypothetical protein